VLAGEKRAAAPPKESSSVASDGKAVAAHGKVLPPAEAGAADDSSLVPEDGVIGGVPVIATTDEALTSAGMPTATTAQEVPVAVASADASDVPDSGALQTMSVDGLIPAADSEQSPVTAAAAASDTTTQAANVVPAALATPQIRSALPGAYQGALPPVSAESLTGQAAPLLPAATATTIGGVDVLGPDGAPFKPVATAANPLQPTLTPVTASAGGSSDAVQSAAAYDRLMESAALRQGGSSVPPPSLSAADGLLAEASDEQLARLPATALSATTAAPAAAAGSMTATYDSSLSALVKPDVLLTTPNQQAWGDEVGARVRMLFNTGATEARLQLTPADLGTLDIRIATDGDRASVVFSVQNADARDAIEQAMPRLKELLEQSGLQLAHTEVSDQSQSQRDLDQNTDELSPSALAALEPGEDDDGELPVARQLGVTRSLVDYYA
tara:strand:- start:2143 stop:3468 length:1326 start_codon:yes stop_codon:yes gene_type:complete